jgi:ubiquinone/menaquinone biosynthesis C-methylase UbiE
MNRVQRPGVQTGYDMWAPSYDVTENPAVHLDRRFTLQALAAQAGERILDAGCGTGAHASAVHQKAVRVVGVEQVDLAQTAGSSSSRWSNRVQRTCARQRT